MKAVVLVSSKTGNTYKIARYVQKGFGDDCDLLRTTDKYDLSRYDTVLVGFWLDSGHVDNDSLALLKKLYYKKVGIFGTLGGDPKSEAASKVMQSAVDALNDGHRCNMLLGTFFVQGKISKDVLKVMYEKFPGLKNDEKHIKRINAAATHPDAVDRIKALLEAQYWKKQADKVKARG